MNFEWQGNKKRRAKSETRPEQRIEEKTILGTRIVRCSILYGTYNSSSFVTVQLHRNKHAVDVLFDLIDDIKKISVGRLHISSRALVERQTKENLVILYQCLVMKLLNFG